MTDSSIDPYATPDNQSGKTCFCLQCGKEILAGSAHCPFCHSAQFQGKRKSKGVAAALGIFLGFLGAHRLYLGQWWGIFYLLFSTIGWLVAIIESIVFLATPKQSWERKYGNIAPSSTAMIVGVIIASIFVIGILAAVALPAYQDYTNRVKVAESLNQLTPIKTGIANYVTDNQRFPSSLKDIGLEDFSYPKIVSDIKISDDGKIRIRFSTEQSAINGETLVLMANRAETPIQWDCSGGTLPSMYRPVACRTGKFQKQQALSSTVVINDDLRHFEIRVPKSWSLQKDLDPSANLQLANLRREEYLVSYERDFDSLGTSELEQFASMVNDSFELPQQSFKPKIEVNVNGLPGIRFDISGEVNGVDIEYMMIYLKGEERFYFLSFWTLPEKKKDAWQNFSKAVQSFKEI